MTEPAGSGLRYAAKAGSIRSRVGSSLRERGPRATARRAFEFGSAKWRSAITPLVRPFFRGHSVTYDGRRLPYVVRRHNATWSNERVVELAIVRDELSRAAGAICEIGAVLRHYPDLDRPGTTTIDKYEQATGVIRADLLEFFPDDRFALVVSVSTLEHLGIDEHDHPEAPERALAALEHVSNHLLAPGGRAVITVPVGYNPRLDQLVAGERRVAGTTVGAVYRRETGWSNRWTPCAPAEVRGATYGSPFRTASAIAILVVEPAPS